MKLSYKELCEKVKTADSAKEIQQLAKDNGVKLEEGSADRLYQRFQEERELKDKDLDKVTGGGCGHSDPGPLVWCSYCQGSNCSLVFHGNGTETWHCNDCDRDFDVMCDFDLC